MSDEKPILTISNLHVGIEGTPILKGDRGREFSYLSNTLNRFPDSKSGIS